MTSSDSRTKKADDSVVYILSECCRKFLRESGRPLQDEVESVSRTSRYRKCTFHMSYLPSFLYAKWLQGTVHVALVVGSWSRNVRGRDACLTDVTYALASKENDSIH